MRWLDEQDRPSVHITAISRAEMLLGVELLPLGRRRTDLSETIERIFAKFAGRILSFDENAARGNRWPQKVARPTDLSIRRHDRCNRQKPRRITRHARRRRF